MTVTCSTETERCCYPDPRINGWVLWRVKLFGTSDWTDASFESEGLDSVKALCVHLLGQRRLAMALPRTSRSPSDASLTQSAHFAIVALVVCSMDLRRDLHPRSDKPRVSGRLAGAISTRARRASRGVRWVTTSHVQRHGAGASTTRRQLSRPMCTPDRSAKRPAGSLLVTGLSTGEVIDASSSRHLAAAIVICSNGGARSRRTLKTSNFDMSPCRWARRSGASLSATDSTEVEYCDWQGVRAARSGIAVLS